MAQELSALELHFLSLELQGLVLGKLEKVYQWGKEEFVFRFYTKEGKKHLRVVVPGLAHFTSKSYSGPRIPPGFCSFLRKYTANAIVKAVYQQGFERVIVFELESKVHGYLFFVVEVLKPGNVVLCRKEGDSLVTMHPLRNERFKDRDVLPRKEYFFPRGQPDVKSLDFDSVKELLLKSDKPVVKCLAMELGFGGVYAEELVLRSGVEKSVVPRDLSGDGVEALVSAVKNVFSEEPSPFLSKGRVYPVRMASIKDKEKSFGSFSEGLDEVFFEEKLVLETSESSKAKDKASVIISAQEKNLGKFEKAASENQRAAEAIYENYSFFAGIMSEVKKMRSEKKPWKEIEEYLKGKPGFVSLDEKNKQIVFEIKK